MVDRKSESTLPPVIYPAPARHGQPSVPEAGPMPAGPSTSSTADPKAKRSTVRAACEACRKRRSKCDAARPVCQACKTKKTECRYDVEPGQSRLDALKARNEHLETTMAGTLELFWQLQHASQDEANRLLDTIRSGVEMSELSRRISNKSRSESGRTGSSGMEFQADFADAMPYGGGREPAAESETHSKITSPESSHRPSTASRNLSGASGLAAVLPESPEFTLTLPSLDELQTAIACWETCSGDVFYTFQREELEGLLGQAQENGLSSMSAATVCVLCATAAVGALFSREKISSDRGTAFYRSAKVLFDECVTQNNLYALKVAVLMALFNVLLKATVAFAYLDLATSLARQMAILTPTRPLGMSPERWDDCRRILRTLELIKDWVGSTMGYLDEDQTLKKLDLIDTMAPTEHDSTPTQLIQDRFARLARIKAGILRTVSTFSSISPVATASMRQDLRNWHASLPPEMRLEYLFNGGSSTYMIGIGQLHMMNVGAICLLNRPILASHLLSESPDLSATSRASREHEALVAIHECLGAADQGSKLSHYLLGQGGIYEKCWPTIYQAYSCTVIQLYTATQQILHAMSQTAWREKLSDALKCLRILVYCSDFDVVARKLRMAVEPYYLQLDQLTPQNIQSILGPEHLRASAPMDGYRYLIMPPRGDSKLHQTSRSLLTLLCHPFTNIPLTAAPFQIGPAEGRKADPTMEGFEYISAGATQRRASFGEEPPKLLPLADLKPLPPILPSEAMDWARPEVSAFDEPRPPQRRRLSPPLGPRPSIQSDPGSTIAHDVMARLQEGRFVGSTTPHGWSIVVPRRPE